MVGKKRSTASGPESGHVWEVVFDEEFFVEFEAWPDSVQDAVLSSIGKLRAFGPSLGRPTVDTLKGSAYANMKELRVDALDAPWRIAFAFDPKRKAILLTGGSKSGIPKDRFYLALIRVADARYREHLRTMGTEGNRK